MTTNGGGTFWILENEKGNRDAETLIGDIFEQEKIQEKKQREKKKDKKSSSTAESSSIQETEEQAQFRYSHFVCSPPGTTRKTVIPINQYTEGSRQQHKETCWYCIEKEEQRKRELELEWEGPKRVKFCIHMISQARQDIETAERKIQQERERKDLQGWERDWIIRDLRIRELEPSEFQLSKEKAELQKLLEHPNPIIREGAREEYKKYLDRRKKKNSFHQS